MLITAGYLNYNDMQMRGSSQVINVGDYHVAITHLCELWFNEKNQKSLKKRIIRNHVLTILLFHQA